MPKPKKYWGVERNANRHGRLRWYFRRPDRKGAPRIRLPDSYGSLAFEAAWRAAMAGQPLPLGPGRARARQSRGTLGWLVRLYLTSAEFQAFRPATRKQRVAMLERLAAEKGAVDLEDIGKGAIQDSLNARRATPPMANVWLGTVSNLFAWATRECLPDPLTGASAPILAENRARGSSDSRSRGAPIRTKSRAIRPSAMRTLPASKPPMRKGRASAWPIPCCSIPV
jgi:hypothetical protein